MKLIISKLEKQIKELEKLVAKRDEYHTHRSELWYGSNLEHEHDEKTLNIKESIKDLKNTVEDLKDLI